MSRRYSRREDHGYGDPYDGRRDTPDEKRSDKMREFEESQIDQALRNSRHDNQIGDRQAGIYDNLNGYSMDDIERALRNSRLSDIANEAGEDDSHHGWGEPGVPRRDLQGSYEDYRNVELRRNGAARGLIRPPQRKPMERTPYSPRSTGVNRDEIRGDMEQAALSRASLQHEETQRRCTQCGRDDCASIPVMERPGHGSRNDCGCKKCIDRLYGWKEWNGRNPRPYRADLPRGRVEPAKGRY